MEKLLDEEHEEKVQAQQKEMDELRRKGGQIPKWTASAIVGYRATPFLVEDGVVTLRGEPCPRKKPKDGRSYVLVPNFASQIAEFRDTYPRYEVVFQDIMTLHYEGEGNPAKLHALDAEGNVTKTVDIFDFDDFDIHCL